MTRKSAKKRRASKHTKLAPKDERASPQNAASAKPVRLGGPRIKFGMHGMASIVQAVSDAGLEAEFNEALGDEEKFVTVQRKSLAKIKEFVMSKPELAGFAETMQTCDCDPADPYCIYI